MLRRPVHHRLSQLLVSLRLCTPASLFSRVICVTSFTSIHHFLLESWSAQFTVSSSALASWAVHFSIIRLKSVLLEVCAPSSCCCPFIVHVSMSWFSRPRCQVVNLLGFHGSLHTDAQNLFLPRCFPRGLFSTPRLVSPCGVS